MATKTKGKSSAKAGGNDLLKKYGMASLGLIGGGGLMMIGSLMDWASAAGVSKSGFDGRGELTFLAGLVLVLVGLAPFVARIRELIAGVNGHVVSMAALGLAGYALGSEGADAREAQEAADAAVAAAVQAAGNIADYAGSLAGSFQVNTETGYWIVLAGSIVAALAAGLHKLGKHVEEVNDVTSMSSAEKKMMLIPLAVFVGTFALFYWVI